MRRMLLMIGLVSASALCGGGGRASAQAPTIDTGTVPGPGSTASLLGASPGSNAGALGSSPGAGGAGQGGQQGGILSGRAGPSIPRVPSNITQPGGIIGVPEQTGIAAPSTLPTAEMPLYGSLAEPGTPEDEGPADGLTLDMAIDRMVRQNLDLLARYYEVPQATADILTASLRANPVFYADTQLVPYGQYSNARPGGPAQYDINISHPLDISRKRQARIFSAVRAKRVLEAQYQDAVRLQIDNLYTAYVDVLAARETVRYAETSVKGLRSLLDQLEARLKAGEDIQAQVSKIRIQLYSSEVGLADSRALLRKNNRNLGTLLFLPPDQAENLQVRGTIFDKAPPPPPVDELIKLALDVRPDLQSFRLGVQRAEADVRLARANRLQDLYLLYQPYTFQNNQPFGTKSATSWAIGITVPLPVYNRNQGGIQRAQLNVTQTQIQLSALERQVINDVQQAAKEYDISHEAVTLVHERVLPAAEQVLKTAKERFGGGEEQFRAILEAQKDYNDIFKQYRDTVVRHRRSMLDLNTAVGQRILP